LRIRIQFVAFIPDPIFDVALKKILVLRFSAMGDVVLLVPVIKSLVAAYPEVEVTIVTRPKFASFFTDMERVVPFPADVDHTYNGLFGMRDLFKKLMMKGSYEVVVDMHDHIRTIMLRSLFKIFTTPVIVFEKGRSDKKTFTQRENKATTPLIHTVERYRRAFEKAGFPFSLLPPPYFKLKDSIQNEVTDWLNQNHLVKNEKWIGIAPFAMHTSKIWPVENYAEVMKKITDKSAVKFFLFGGGEKEIEFFETLKQAFPNNCVVVAGKLKLKQELALMEKLDMMLCVDSSNMHLASLLGIRILSIWGGTHTDVGFGPFGKGPESIIEIGRDQLPCRPCSVYGREKCLRGDFACLTWITSDAVVERIEKSIQ
jgi:ADP-heptose:LPS heptosyltransferase